MLGSGTQIKPWLDLVYRRRYWILIPGLLGLVGGIVALSQMPKMYMASTTILVTPQSIPQEFVPTQPSQLQDRVNTLSVSVLSRAYLEPVAREFKLIGPNAKEAAIAKAVADLASTVRPELDTMRPPKWFKIHVESGNPILAAGVANALANAFIEQNAKLRETQAGTTLATANKFLAEIQAKLNEQQAKVARYKSDKLWQLPDQTGVNIQLLNATQARIVALDNDIQARQNQLSLLRLSPQLATPMRAVGGPVAVDPAVAHYEQLKRELYELELRNTEMHPDVKRKRDEVAQWVKANPHVTAPPSVASGDEDVPAQGLSATDLEMMRLEKEIKKLQADKARAEGEIGNLTGRIAAAPTRAQEIEELTRDLSTQQQEYQVWLTRKSNAEKALALESANQGEQFKIQDTARVPAIPYKPVPAQVILMGLAVGLGLGAGASFLLEFLDNSIRTEEEFSTAFPDLPLLASIPDLDRAARTRKKRTHSRRAAAL